MTDPGDITRAGVTVWGKTDLFKVSEKRGGPAWNPLLAHMLDVAACTGELWDHYLATPVRDRLTEALGSGSADLARRNTMFYAALHDLGKASAGFQLRFFDTDRGHVRKAAKEWLVKAREHRLPLPADLRAARRLRHELVTAFCLPRLLGCACGDCGGTGVPHLGLHRVALLLGGHHGHIPGPDLLERAPTAAPAEDWDDIHRFLLTALARLLDVDLDRLPEQTSLSRPAALPLFAGLVVTADWIASDDNRFDYRAGGSIRQWWQDAKEQARTAVRELRLRAWEPKPAPWAQLFPDTPGPRPFQTAAMNAAPAEGPALAVIEAGTGAGKTALALWLAHHLARTNGYHGLYTAMPTRAATDQAAVEHIDFLTRAFGRPAEANLAIVHGAAEATDTVHRLLDTGEASTPPDDLTDLTPFVESTICDRHDREAGTAVVLDPWYLRRCLGLVSTFGVGTVDQVTLASQRSAHWFLRLFGLANKTVVIDEAHAYQLFQERLLAAAVSWLADAGASVVVLSATLPAAAREALITAWCRGHRTTAEPTDAQGPITFVDQYGRITRTAPDEPPAELHTQLDLLPDPGAAALADRLLSEASGGGITTVIRNRVGAAHDLYVHALDRAESHGWSRDEILLLHGRLAPRDRLPREARIRRLIGPGEKRDAPNPRRPARLLVISTQVIEQSLDLDSDRLYTDLAPVDLLIQRRGRLHRHAVNDSAGTRPAAMRTPRMTVLWQPDQEHLPLVQPPERRTPGNRDALVYAPYALAATWHQLTERTTEDACPQCEDARRADPGSRIACLSTPRDNESLIESVYDPRPFPRTSTGRLLSATWESWSADLAKHTNAAKAYALQPYHPDDGTPVDIHLLESGGANGHGTDGAPGLAARSRLAERSVEAVLLYHHPSAEEHPSNHYSYDPQGRIRADLKRYSRRATERAARRAQQRNLLLNTVSVPHHWFEHLPPAEYWENPDIGVLRHRHVIILKPDGTSPEWSALKRLRYDPDRGLHLAFRR
ncbi:CRISPR-associated Cas3 family helicase [Streptomyces sp. 1114.5]|uniref:CRISPR-associated helicase Cas3' n=1 Tax=Streptomyces sp. 1114.5 TaxID=1938830 RepID=UPI000EB34575|nr:CRISPR-associated helicase Cas3' [Streptomyces sp. 1114.5]RKT09505.1 CRISPR-associated Cas3 family helicase [Streptomyces sp. 1114.5]